MPLKNNGSVKKSKEKFLKIPSDKEKQNCNLPNLPDTARAVLRRKYIVINIYIEKEERSQISKLSLYLKELEKEEQTNSEVRRRKKKKKRPEWNKWNRVEINEIESKKTIEKIIETKIYCFKKMNKIDKTLSRLTKK